MTPYYDENGITIYCGDSVALAGLWASADVLITDPPYGTAGGGGYGRRHTGTIYGQADAPRTIANDEDTVVRDKILTMWGSRPAAVFASPRLPEPPGVWADRLVWDKKRPGMNGGPWRYRHEMIYVTAGWTRVSDAAVSVFVEFPDQRYHLHAKPPGVMAALVAAAPPGVIADPFMGSGSTLVAARELGRRAIGVEIDESYCQAAVNRLAQGVLEFG